MLVTSQLSQTYIDIKLPFIMKAIFLFGLMLLGTLAADPYWLFGCRDTVSDCRYCTSPDTCGFCMPGHWLHDNQCLDCNLAVGWCSLCSSSGHPCHRCEPGFYLTAVYSSCTLNVQGLVDWLGWIKLCIPKRDPV